MTQSKPYTITRIVQKNENNEMCLQIWMKLNNNSEKCICAIKNVVVDNIDNNNVNLFFSGNSPEMLRWVGGDIKHREFCFSLSVDESTFYKLQGSHRVSFFIRINSEQFRESIQVDF